MQQGSSTQPTAADPYWIASYFVSKYYDVLAKNPVYFNRFYKAQSTLTVIDMADDATPGTTAVGEQDIQQQVNNSIAGAAARHKLVDAQFSMNGGILLSVAGTVLLKGVDRNFTQTFFLAPQENGFYVFNDVLRIFPPTPAAGLPASSSVPAAPSAAPAPSQAPVAAPAPAPSPPASTTISYAAPEQTQPHATASPSPPPPSAPPAAAAPHQPPAAPQQQPQQQAAVPSQQRAPTAPQRAASGAAAAAAAAAAPQRTASPAPAAAAAPAAASPPTPSTWAEIARLKQKEQQVSSSPAPAAKETAAPAQQPAVAAAPAPAEKPVANGTHHAPAADSTSTSHAQPAQHTILVKNLPPEHLQIEMLESEFSKFGALHRRGAGAVTIHNTGREGKVAYIKFADAGGVEAALQATVPINDRIVEISRHEGPLPSFGRGGSGGRGGGPYRGGGGSGGSRAAAGRGGSYGDSAAPRGERGERRGADGVRGDGRGAGEGRGSGEGRGARLERRPSSGAAAGRAGGSSGRGSGRNGAGRREDQAATAVSKD